MAAKEKSNLAPCSAEALRKATGRNWQQWLATLDKAGARQLAHRELARMIGELHSAGEWWSQTIAVGYERLSGTRALYGRPDGTFSASVSKTINTTAAAVYDAIADDEKRTTWTPGRLTLRNATPHKVVRLDSKDGARVIAYLQSKPNAKTVVALEITKLPSSEAVAAAKQQWRAALEQLAKKLQ